MNWFILDSLICISPICWFEFETWITLNFERLDLQFLGAWKLRKLKKSGSSEIEACQLSTGALFDLRFSLQVLRLLVGRIPTLELDFKCILMGISPFTKTIYKSMLKSSSLASSKCNHLLHPFQRNCLLSNSTIITSFIWETTLISMVDMSEVACI